MEGPIGQGIETRIGIGNAEGPKNPPLLRLHGFGLGIAAVIVAEQMQHTVHDQMGGMIAKRNAKLTRLALGGLIGDDDVTDRVRESRLF